jgi:hypothetical protein
MAQSTGASHHKPRAELATNKNPGDFEMRSTTKSRHAVGALALLIASFSLPATAGFVFTDFSDVSGLNLVGNAAQSGTALRLTPSLLSQTGAAWYGSQIAVGGGFTTDFTFRISDLQNTGSDGFTFAVQNSSGTAMGLGGGDVGYGGIANSVAVKFDTHQNGGEPPAPFVSVQAGGNAAAFGALATAASIPNIKDAAVHTARIQYAPGTMPVILDNMSTPVLNVSLLLSSLISLNDGEAYVGFTAATGGGFENHDILSWRVTSVPEPGTLALLGAMVLVGARRSWGKGQGCASSLPKALH